MTIAQRQAMQLSKRPRRLRSSAAMRELVAETTLSAHDFIAPFFVIPGKAIEQPIAALPGISRFSSDRLLAELEHALELGVKAALLFGVVPTEAKSQTGKSAADPQGPVVSALKAARQAFGNDLTLLTDVCLCGYTDHGHCGLLKETPRGWVVDNDSSLEQLARMALAHAEAGADMVSPSDMMDGRVAYLRDSLDAQGHSSVGILSYAVKYASAFYGPFRDAAGSAPSSSVSIRDRKTYQMDPRNTREALREAVLDESEAADMLMVKPALPYLDILSHVRQHSSLPLVAYNVSGEYAMIKAAAAAAALEEAAAVKESLIAMRRAGADLIISYHALEALEKGWI